MERTQTYISCAATFEFYEVAHYVDNVGGVKDALYGCSVYSSHFDCKYTKKRNKITKETLPGFLCYLHIVLNVSGLLSKKV